MAVVKTQKTSIRINSIFEASFKSLKTDGS